MNEYMMLVAILLPIVGGVVIPLIKWKNRTAMLVYTELLTMVTSVIVLALLIFRPTAICTVLYFPGNLSVAFHLDGLASLFAGLIAVLWPFSVCYSMEYMKHEKRERFFFMFYVMTYGVTLGIAMSANIMTMYFFYELLTLVTVPLVLHTLTREAIHAARKYIYYSLGGAAFAFLGMVFLVIYSTNSAFTYGGFLNLAKVGGKENLLLLIYVFAFFGFGVKAAVCPFNSWLPTAGVAPTPVTALLHAVAVVKSGAFAIIRLTYYCYGVDFLKGTVAQYVVMTAAIITILYGSGMAVKERHLKRRLAYSTISNLSYILFGVTIMTPLGFVGALAHLVCHAFMKIASFFCAGAVIYKTEKNYIYELNGLGRKMKKVFAVFTISSFALMGVPGLCGFISKFYLSKAAFVSGNKLAYLGVAVLLVSALLTAIYMLTIVIRAYFSPEEISDRKEDTAVVSDPGWQMILPLVFFVCIMFLLGLYSHPLIAFLEQIAKGLL
ncbi:MAG: complex I subunit 5 family protein [Lachnospiraceae bacterium]